MEVYVKNIHKKQFVLTMRRILIFLAMASFYMSNITASQLSNYTFSDSVFERGVNCYYEQNFIEASKCFSICDSIDNLHSDSTNTRKIYSRMWLASSFYKMGDTVMAKKLDRHYMYEPINRKFILASDSLANVAVSLMDKGDFGDAYQIFKTAQKIEHKHVDPISWFNGGVNLYLLVCELNLQKYDDAMIHATSALKIYNRYTSTDSTEYDLAKRLALLVIPHVSENKLKSLIPDYLKMFSTENHDISLSQKCLSYDVIAKLCYYSKDYERAYSNQVLSLLEECNNGNFEIIADRVFTLGLIGFKGNKIKILDEYLTNYINYLNKNKTIKDAVDPTLQTCAFLAYYYLNSDIHNISDSQKWIDIIFDSVGRNNIAVPKYLGDLYQIASYFYNRCEFDKSLAVMNSIINSYEYFNIFPWDYFDYSLSLAHTYVDIAQPQMAKSLILNLKNKFDEIYSANDPHRVFFYGSLAQFVSVVDFDMDFIENLNEEISKYDNIDICTMERPNDISEDRYYSYLFNILHSIVLANNISNHSSISEALEILDTNILNSVEIPDRHKMSFYTLKVLGSLQLKRWEDCYKAGQFCIDKKELMPIINLKDIYYVTGRSMIEINGDCRPEIASYYSNSLALSKEIVNRNMSGLNRLAQKKFWNREKITIESMLSDIAKLLVANQYDDLNRLFYDLLLYYKSILLSIEIKNINSKILYDIDQVSYKEIVSELKDNEVAIEFYDLSNNLDSSKITIAAILRSGFSFPQIVNIGKFDSGMLTNNAEMKCLSTKIWSSLNPYIQSRDKVYFSASESLCTIPIESFFYDTSETCTNESSEVLRLTTTGLIAHRKNRALSKTAVVFGGIDFGIKSENILTSNSDYTSDAGNRYILDNRRSELPASRVEAITIDSLLNLHSYNSDLWLGKDGTENKFKSYSMRSPNIIHIATHGFYLTDKEARKIDGLSFILDESSCPDDDYTLSRSGMYLAVSNASNYIPDNDGVLTALEISKLDLSNSDFVVLSACQTGLGDLQGDGVFGLQRGFKKAGVNSMMLSLWKVDDEATQIFMTKFYERFLQGESKHQSLIYAQNYLKNFSKTIIDNGVESEIHPYSDPKYWSAFILLDANE